MFLQGARVGPKGASGRGHLCQDGLSPFYCIFVLLSLLLDIVLCMSEPSAVRTVTTPALQGKVKYANELSWEQSKLKVLCPPFKHKDI